MTADLLWLVARVVCAAVFGFSGLMKLLHATEWRGALAEYRLPWLLSSQLPIAVAFAELGLAAGLCAVEGAFFAVAAGIMAIGFAVTIALAYQRGARGDCGCFGGAFRTSIGRGSMLRALVLAALCFVSALEPAGGGWGVRAALSASAVIVALLAVEGRATLRSSLNSR
jgi:Methylamine utilisation protein MauE